MIDGEPLFQPQGAKPPLFMIHPLGGEVLCYRNLSIDISEKESKCDKRI